MGNVTLKRVVKVSAKITDLDLDLEYGSILKDSEINTLYLSMKTLEPNVNLGLKQTLNLLIKHSQKQVAPLSYDNVKSYFFSIVEQVDDGDRGKRVYKANLKKFFTLVDFGAEITSLVSQRKGRSRNSTIASSKVTGYVPVSNTKRRMKSHKPKHKSQGLSNEQAKLPSEGNVTRLNPLEITIKNSNNKLVTIDLRDVFNSPFISDIEITQFAKRIHDSPLRDASKHGYINTLRQLIEFNNKVTKSPEFYNKSVFQPFIKDLLNAVEKGELNIKVESIERKQTTLSAAFELISLPKIARVDRFKLKTGGNDLQTDNYDDTSWKATVRALVPEHQRLYKDVLSRTKIYESDYNDFIACSCLLLTLYTGMTFSEIITLMYEEFDTEHTSLGSKDYVYSAIKYRSDAVNEYDSFIARISSKTLVVRLMEVVERAKTQLGLDSTNVIFFIRQGVAVQPNSNDIRNFGERLTKWNQGLQSLLRKRPKYKLNLQRLRSSVIQRISSKRGEASGVRSGRHRLSVHRSYNYSKVSNESAQIALTKTTHALEEYAKGTTIHLAVEYGKSLYDPKIITEEEKQDSGLSELKNGGTCNGKESAESREFQKKLDRNQLLTDDDKKQMGCGFIIKCFGCANFAVVDEVNDIWKLLSFESILNDSINYHISLAHFIEKQGALKKKIEVIKGKLSPKKLATAVKKLNKQGLHPLWNGMYAVVDKMDL